MAHLCPIAGCRERIGNHLLMCRRHWRMVPARLQGKVYALYQNGEGVGTPELKKAQQDAIASVEEQAK